MAKLLWDQSGEKFFENGVDHGVLYVKDDLGVYGDGVVWNGLTTVTESPTGAESNKQYADNIVYANLYSVEEFGATIEAFTYPDEFAVCDGSAEPVAGVYLGQQPRKAFGFSYRTIVGNDLNARLGYKIHIVWDAMAAPSEKAYATVNDSPELTTLSWELTTTPTQVTGHDPAASMTIDSTKVTPTQLAALEDLLYGDATTGIASLPTPDEVIAIFETP